MVSFSNTEGTTKIVPIPFFQARKSGLEPKHALTILVQVSQNLKQLEESLKERLG